MRLSDLPERIRTKVVLKRPLTDEARSFCWVWKGATARGRYAVAHWDGRLRVLHRAILEADGRPCPPGLECDHLCCRRNCIRPDHIEYVTHSENIHRLIARGRVGARSGWDKNGQSNKTKTHCIHGHEFTKANTLPNAYGKGRRCRTCKLEQEKLRKRRLRAGGS